MIYFIEKVVCYWRTCAGYRIGDGQFDASFINPKICTHIIYSFIGTSADGTVNSLDPFIDYQKDGGYLKKFVALRSQNPSVKLMVSAGGWSFGSAVFSQLAANVYSRKNFAQNVVNFCRNNYLDGFDLDWEYPAQRDGNAAVDKINFSALLFELKRALSGAGLLLSFASASAQFSAQISYDIRTVASNVDFINIMAYDLHGPWDGYTGIHGALYAGPDQNKQLNADACIKYWISQGAPREKLILGIPTFGKSFTLANVASNGIGAKTIGSGTAGPWTNIAGSLGYNEICMNCWPRFWQPEQKVPYAINGNQWVGYDDVNSVSNKANYIMQNGLGGAMFSSLETDDFRGNCGQGRYPLISTGYGILMNGNVSTSHILLRTLYQDYLLQVLLPIPIQSTVIINTITVPTGGLFICPKDGLFKDPARCDKFYQCANGIAYSQPCPSGLLFDVSLLVCNWPASVQC